MSENTTLEVVDEYTTVEVINENIVVEIIDEYIDIIEIGIQGPPGVSMPSGGLKDEILTKKSNIDYDYEWKKPKVILEKYENINENELTDSLLWNNTTIDAIQYYNENNIKTLLYSEGSKSDQILSGSTEPYGNLILKSTSNEIKGSIIIPEFNFPGFIKNDEFGNILSGQQIEAIDLPSHTSLTTEYGVADKNLYGHVKIGDGIAVDNGVIKIDDNVATLNDRQILINKTLTSPILVSPIIQDENSIIDENGNKLLTFKTKINAKNNIVIENSIINNGPKIYPVGEDENIDLILNSKGHGNVKIDNDVITTNTSFQVVSNKVLIDNVIESVYPREDKINRIYFPDINDTIVTLNATQVLTNKTLTEPKFINQGFIADVNGNELLVFNSYDLAVNNITIENAINLNSPIIKATGDNDNIDLVLKAKGTGSVKIDDDIITTNNANQILNNKTLIEPIINSFYLNSEKTNKIIFPEISDTVVTLNAIQTLINKTLTTPKIINNDYISDINGNKLLAFDSTPGASTYLKLTNNISENNVILETLGSTNVGLNIIPSGLGTIQINNDIITTNTAEQTLLNKILIEPTINNLINANHNHSNSVNGGQITDSALSSPVTPAKGGTGFSSYTLGDIIYATSTNTLNKLPGNITTDTKLLTQTGTGTESKAPEWKKYKHEQTIGDGINTEYIINHNLNTRAHTISVWRNVFPYDEIDYYVEKTTLNTITLYFSRVLELDEFSVVIIG